MFKFDLKFKPLISLALVLLVAVCSAGCSKQPGQPAVEPASPQPQDQASSVPQDWQKYESQTHQFSFYYPPQWSLKPELNRAELLTFSLEFKDQNQQPKTFWDNTTGQPYYSLAARIEKNPDNLSALDWEVKQVIDIAREEAKEKYQVVTIADHQGVKQSGKRAPAGIFHSYTFCPGNGFAYTFTYSADAHPDTQEKYLDLAEKMISFIEFGQ